MKDNLKLIDDEINIFHEGRKRRLFVGKLKYKMKSRQYELVYDQQYAYLDNAIPLGPELSLLKLHHVSKKDELFPSFKDRIPSKDNPAYKDYCESQGVCPDETNAIVLLGFIGKRGPSSFIFEPVYLSAFCAKDIKKIRNIIGISQHDLSMALNISRVTLARLETGTSSDFNTLKRIEMFFTFSEVALWQLKQTGGWLHSDTLTRLIRYFEQQS